MTKFNLLAIAFAPVIALAVATGPAHAQLKPGTPAYRACLQEMAPLYLLGDRMLGSGYPPQSAIIGAWAYCAGSARLSAN